MGDLVNTSISACYMRWEGIKVCRSVQCTCVG